MKAFLPALLVVALSASGAALAQSEPAQNASGTPSTAPAQSGYQSGHQRHPHDPAREAKHLSKRLNLSPDQTAQVEPILADRDARMKALMSDNATDPKATHQQMRSIMSDTDQKLTAVLNDQQKAQYEQMKAAHRHGHHGSPQTQPAAPAPSL